MTWQEKMNKVVQGVLEDGHYLNVLTDKSFEIKNKDNEVVLEVKTVHSLESHWRLELAKSLSILNDMVIRQELSKV